MGHDRSKLWIHFITSRGRVLLDILNQSFLSAFSCNISVAYNVNKIISLSNDQCLLVRGLISISGLGTRYPVVGSLIAGIRFK